MVMNKLLKDALDRRIYSTACENPGIRLANLSQRIGYGIVTVRYRVLDLEREGILHVEKGRNCIKIYPVIPDNCKKDVDNKAGDL